MLLPDRSQVTRPRPPVFKADDDEDKMSGRMSIGSKKKANVAREKSNDQRGRDEPFDDKNKPVLNRLLAHNASKKNMQSEFEEDFLGQMENVTDKNQSIKILNASQGRVELTV